METNNMFEGETVLSVSDDKSITLTDKRIRRTVTSLGKLDYMSIPLEKISCVELRYRSWILMLVLGILSVGLSVYSIVVNNSDIAMTAGLAGLFFIVLYFLTRRHLIVIVSDSGTKMNIATRGMKTSAVLGFLDKIQEARGL